MSKKRGARGISHRGSRRGRQIQSRPSSRPQPGARCRRYKLPATRFKQLGVVVAAAFKTFPPPLGPCNRCHDVAARVPPPTGPHLDAIVLIGNGLGEAGSKGFGETRAFPNRPTQSVRRRDDPPRAISGRRHTLAASERESRCQSGGEGAAVAGAGGAYVRAGVPLLVLVHWHHKERKNWRRRAEDCGAS